MKLILISTVSLEKTKQGKDYPDLCRVWGILLLLVNTSLSDPFIRLILEWSTPAGVFPQKVKRWRHLLALISLTYPTLGDGERRTPLKLLRYISCENPRTRAAIPIGATQRSFCPDGLMGIRRNQ